MLIIARTCEKKDCGQEVMVILSEKNIRDKLYVWECPTCKHMNPLQVVFAK